MTNHLWQSTVFAITAGLLTLAFRRYRAQVRYWLWFSASAKFLIPFAFLISLGSHFERAVPSYVAAPATSAMLVEMTQPFDEAVPPAVHGAGDTYWLRIAIIAIWACGFGAVAFLRFQNWLRIRSALGASSPIRIPASVPIHACPGLVEPGVVGLFRPVLLFPEGLDARLAPRELEAVVEHELAHIRRRDNLTAALHMIVEALFWFHPLVWWIGARLLEERESACDEAVLSFRSEPRVYAQAILSVSKSYLKSPLPCISGVTVANLKKRIEAILSGRVAPQLTFAGRATLVFAGVVAVGIPILIGTMNSILLAQPRSATLRFETASIKPCQSDGPRSSGGQVAAGDRLITGCTTVADLVSSAYGIWAKGHLDLDLDYPIPPVAGGPSWAHSARYQINAKAEGFPGQGILSGPMMQALLEDRFKLKILRESKQAPVYALRVAPSGPKLPPFAEGTCTPIDPGPVVGPLPQNACRVGARLTPPKMALMAPGVKLTDFSKLLNMILVLDRPVVDRPKRCAADAAAAIRWPGWSLASALPPAVWRKRPKTALTR
jgi:uncharacterized protein (TIGR03435 family)